MKFTVVQFKPFPENYHICRDEAGEIHRIDLMIDGTFPHISPVDLVGKTVEVERLSPYMELAYQPRIIPA